MFEALQRASECGVLMILLPPHTSHRLQPLDLCFFQPLKTYCYQELEKWLRNHPGRAVLQYEIGQLFGCAYGKAASCNIAFNGFCKAGIHPLNRDVFDETNFLPAGVSDRPIEENDTVFNTSGKDIAASAPLTTNSFAPSTTETSAPSTSASCVPLTSASSTPSTSDSSTPSTYASSAPSTSASSANNSSTLLLSVEQINPLPKKSFQSVTKKRKTSKSSFNWITPQKVCSTQFSKNYWNFY